METVRYLCLEKWCLTLCLAFTGNTWVVLFAGANQQVSVYQLMQERVTTDFEVKQHGAVIRIIDLRSLSGFRCSERWEIYGLRKRTDSWIIHKRHTGVLSTQNTCRPWANHWHLHEVCKCASCTQTYSDAHLLWNLHLHLYTFNTARNEWAHYQLWADEWYAELLSLSISVLHWSINTGWGWWCENWLRWKKQKRGHKNDKQKQSSPSYSASLPLVWQFH